MTNSVVEGVLFAHILTCFNATFLSDSEIIEQRLSQHDTSVKSDALFYTIIFILVNYVVIRCARHCMQKTMVSRYLVMWLDL